MGANEDTVRRGYEAFGRGDMDTLRSIMTPDVVQSVPGKSQVSGDHKGVDSVLGYYGTLFELTGGTLKADLQSVKEEGAGKKRSKPNRSARLKTPTSRVQPLVLPR